VLDVPNHRSSHVAPVPRGGGIALAAGALVGTLAMPWGSGHQRLAVSLTAVLFGAIGLGDDLIGVPAVPRLLLQVGAALVVLPLLVAGVTVTPGLWAVVAFAVVVALLAYVNAFNFMDGIDGISVAQALVAGVAFGLLGRSQSIDALTGGGAILAAAAIGFAPYNIPRARVFLGDSGSYFLGAMLAALAIVGVAEGLPPEAVGGPLVLYLADTGSTLVRRVRRGEIWYEPHREHVYQRLVALGWSHLRTTALVAVLIAACSALGVVSLGGSTSLRLAADAAMAVVLGGYLSLPALLHRRRPAVPAARHIDGQRRGANPAVSG
jgi:UDP-GlcNAc:undecaprenyl-phosphate GlcNAc-1-phosphate transferase